MPWYRDFHALWSTRSLLSDPRHYLFFAWSDATLRTYVNVVRRLAVYASFHPDLSWSDLSFLACSQELQRGIGASSVRTVVTVVGFLWKLNIVPQAPPAGLALFNRAARRFRPPVDTRVWADHTSLALLGTAVATVQDAKVFALCVLAFALGLRVSEAAGLLGDALEAATCDPWMLRFHTAKAFDRSPVCERPLMAYPVSWTLCLVHLLQGGGGPWRLRPVFDSTRALQCALQSLASRSPVGHLTWHSWRRGCARTLWNAGSDAPRICTWCRWTGEEMARHYGGPDRSPLALPWELPVVPLICPGPITLRTPGGPAHFWPAQVWAAPVNPAPAPKRPRVP